MAPKNILIVCLLVLAAVLAGLPLDALLGPVIVILVLVAAFHVMLIGAPEPRTGKWLGAVLLLAAIASAWPGVSATLRLVLQSVWEKFHVPSWLLLLLLLLIIAGLILITAKGLALRPPAAKLPKPVARRRERLVAPQEALPPPEPHKPGKGEDELGLFGDHR